MIPRGTWNRARPKGDSIFVWFYLMRSLLSRVRLGSAQNQTFISCVNCNKYTFFNPPKNYSIPPFLLLIGPPNNKTPFGSLQYLSNLWLHGELGIGHDLKERAYFLDFFWVKFMIPRGTWNRARPKGGSIFLFFLFLGQIYDSTGNLESGTT